MGTAKIVFENEYYRVTIGTSELDIDHKGNIYKMVNKDTDMLEYEDMFLPSIISVATNANDALVSCMGGKDDPTLMLIQ